MGNFIMVGSSQYAVFINQSLASLKVGPTSHASWFDGIGSLSHHPKVFCLGGKNPESIKNSNRADYVR